MAYTRGSDWQPPRGTGLPADGQAYENLPKFCRRSGGHPYVRSRAGHPQP